MIGFSFSARTTDAGNIVPVAPVVTIARYLRVPSAFTSIHTRPSLTSNGTTRAPRANGVFGSESVTVCEVGSIVTDSRSRAEVPIHKLGASLGGSDESSFQRSQMANAMPVRG